nr:LysR family transcriptional regulator [uncultured Tolumonas sp.]
MDIRQLKYFIAVAEEQNFGRAAERLHRSQPPLTRQIQMLEEELGVLLFRRTAKGVELTQAGATLQRDAMNILTLVQQATERAQLAAKGQIGILDVGVYGSSALNTIPTILSAFSDQHPEVEIRLHNAHRSVQIEALRQRRVLIAFDRYMPEEDDLAVELVAKEPLAVVCKQNHPLAAKQTISIEDLKNEPMGMPAALNTLTANAALNLCRAHGFEPKVATESTDVITALITLASGHGGVGLVPASVSNLQIPGLVFRPLKEASESFMELHCLYLKDEQSPLLQELLQVVHEYRGENEKQLREHY